MIVEQPNEGVAGKGINGYIGGKGGGMVPVKSQAIIGYFQRCRRTQEQPTMDGLLLFRKRSDQRRRVHIDHNDVDYPMDQNELNKMLDHLKVFSKKYPEAEYSPSLVTICGITDYLMAHGWTTASTAIKP